MKKLEMMKKVRKLTRKINQSSQQVKNMQIECKHEIQVGTESATICMFCRKKLDDLQIIDLDAPEPITILLDSYYPDVYEFWGSLKRAFCGLEACYHDAYKKAKLQKKEDDEYKIGKIMIMELNQFQSELQDEKLLANLKTWDEE